MPIPFTARIAAASCLVLPPVVNTILHVTDPITADDNSRQLLQAGAHPALASLNQFKLVLLLLAPGALVLAAIAARSPRLAFWGGASLCAAVLAGSAEIVGYPLLSVAAHSAHPQAWVPLMNAADHSAVLSVLDLVFPIGQLIGFVLLGLALNRSQAVARWVGFVVIGSAVLNVAAHFVSNRYPGVVAWALLAVAMIACARTLFTGSTGGVGAPSAELRSPSLTPTHAA